MARQLTPEALRFIQQHHYALPETDAYDSAETLIDVDRPFYEGACSVARSRHSEVSNLPPEEDPFEDWLRRAEPSPPVIVGLWSRLLALLQRLLLLELR